MTERSRNTNENPCHMCMPMGGILAMKGVADAMVIVHGSQGCSTYMRRHIAEHFNEPIDVGSSSLNEKGTVYGGEKQLKQAIDNVRRVYNPSVIGIVTTCLAETIGEDVRRTADEYLRERNDAQPLFLVNAATPGYGDSYSEGWQAMVKSLVCQLAQDTPRHDGVNIITSSMLTPADLRELKRILHEMQIEYTLLPDCSDTLDRPYLPQYSKLPEGGTRLEDIQRMSGARATIMLGWTGRTELSAGHWLEETYGVPCLELPLPIGLENSDLLMNALADISERPAPMHIQAERGRLLDAMVDAHKYNFAGRGVLFGDPDWTYALATLCMENGVLPIAVATGSRTARLNERLGKRLAEEREACEIMTGADFAALRTLAQAREANLAIGPSEGRFLEEKAGLPLVRAGFPIHDRVGGQRLLSIGYQGTVQVLDRITNTLLANKHKHYRRKMADAYYKEESCRT